MDVQKAITKHGSRKRKASFYANEVAELFNMSQDKDGKLDLWELATNCLSFGYEKGVSYAAQK